MKIKPLREIQRIDPNSLQICDDFGFIVKDGKFEKIFTIFMYGANGVNFILIPEDGYEDFIEESFRYLENDIILKGNLSLVDSIEITVFPDLEVTKFEIGKTAIKIDLTRDHSAVWYQFINFWCWQTFDVQNNIVGYSKTKELYTGETYGKH